MKKFSVALDGPAASGKSSVAQVVAKDLNITYIDTGAMYRAVTVYCLNNEIDCKNEEAVNKVINNINISLYPDHSVKLNGMDVTREIRLPEVNANVSFIASYKNVRLHLVEEQRKMAQLGSVIMDGRDIGSYVLPNAEVKIFQIASVEVRAKRRYLENQSKGINTTLEEVEAELKKRDYIDSHREFSPLVKADDAITLNTDDLTKEEVIEAVKLIIKDKVGTING